MKLFCFPFSGGSSSVYLNWFKNLSLEIKIYPVELAGRNKRFSESLISSMKDTIQDLFYRLFPLVQAPYALFGHSLGCLIIYELVQVLAKGEYPLPEHIFLSGGIPPHFRNKQTSFHKLQDQEFMAEIIKMGGTPQEFLKNKELQNIFIPIIRSDYKIYETYIPNEEKFFFPCDLTALAGSEDTLATQIDLKHWNDYTNRKFNLVVYEGDHFFIQKHSEQITSLIENTLRPFIQPHLGEK